MKLVVTGGGTGGHVYPALEVALEARANKHDVLYIGSIRGQESNACSKSDIEFIGLNARSLGSLWKPSGWRSLILFLRATYRARKILTDFSTDLVFSTGGYSAAPVLYAASKVGTKIVLHEQNTIPGRTHRYAARFAKYVCIVFEETRNAFPDKTVRTGLPLRKTLLLKAKAEKPSASQKFFTLCMGGSQGASVINEAVLTIVLRADPEKTEWLHVCGPALFESCAKAARRLCMPENYRLKAFLEGNELAEVLFRADLAISRAGAGAISEFALFGIPAIYIPYPYAYANHQMENAKAIEKIGGGTVIPQRELIPERLESVWKEWMSDSSRRKQASINLKEWSIPDATQRVMKIIEEVVNENAGRNR
ncbi:MAG TPA: undecaprenyldiphospho-muramoylpentapeptide beta-N-acetylglucosaminyltransferase [Fimbriimonadales bacterium]|nr:undecaprenyldiphospho-muramoylpentapeptide beta-N-acetylglucosaminyltransferase [Fimbriimonadales bacterium]